MTPHRRRPFLALAIALAVTAVLTWLTTPRRPVSPVGLWVVSERQWRAVNADALPRTGLLSWLFPGNPPSEPPRSRSGPPPFRFDGETVYLEDYPLHAWEVKSKDYVFRLRARWEGRDLHYLNPDRRWEKLATFADGHFGVEQDGVRWVLEKADPGELTERLRPFMKKGRPVWSYPPHDVRH
jgi:hypothetical protein